MILGRKQMENTILSERYILCKPSVAVHNCEAIFDAMVSWTDEHASYRGLDEKA